MAAISGVTPGPLSLMTISTRRAFLATSMVRVGLRRARLGHGLEGVLDQVDDDLFQPDRLGLNPQIGRRPCGPVRRRPRADRPPISSRAPSMAAAGETAETPWVLLREKARSSSVMAPIRPVSSATRVRLRRAASGSSRSR